jgi:hypothetical protein
LFLLSQTGFEAWYNFAMPIRQDLAEVLRDRRKGWEIGGVLAWGRDGISTGKGRAEGWWSCLRQRQRQRKEARGRWGIREKEVEGADRFMDDGNLVLEQRSLAAY